MPLGVTHGAREALYERSGLPESVPRISRHRDLGVRYAEVCSHKLHRGGEAELWISVCELSVPAVPVVCVS